MAIPEIEKMEKAVRDMTFTEPLGEIREQLAKDTQKVFETETAPDGYPWEKLRPATLKRRKRKGRKKLQQEQELLGSLVPTATIDDLNASTLDWGTNVKHAKYHMTGTGDFKGQTRYSGTGKGMVKREFLGVTDEQADQMAETVADHVVKKILESFGD